MNKVHLKIKFNGVCVYIYIYIYIYIYLSMMKVFKILTSEKQQHLIHFTMSLYI